MYLPETPPLPPIKLGDPEYDPFCKNPPPEPLVQLSLTGSGVWICPMCCAVLGTVGGRYKTKCPKCGQKVKEKRYETV